MLPFSFWFAQRLVHRQLQCVPPWFPANFASCFRYWEKVCYFLLLAVCSASFWQKSAFPWLTFSGLRISPSLATWLLIGACWFSRLYLPCSVHFCSDWRQP